jgi:hypothetical protein
MVFVDVGKEYREKVNSFNANSFYGASQAQIQQKEQDRTETRSAGGLNNTAEPTSFWERDNPHRSVLGDQAYLDGTSLWNTKFKETEVNKLQYIQAPQYGFVKNRWTEHLEEIERNRVPNVVPSMVGNGKMVLEVDNNA